MEPEYRYPQYDSSIRNCVALSSPPQGKSPSIPEAFAVLGKMMEEDLELAHRLADRLQPVMRQAVPAPPDGAKLNTASQPAPMVVQIEALQDQANALASLLRSLLDRIEL